MRRILFVDDEPRVLEGLQRTLRPHRHEWDMAFAPGAEAALALLEASPFDVIGVSDMRMPGVDGAALLSRVRELYPQMVRIVLSGQTELAVALRAVPVAHQFLAKPCDASMLRVAVERACHLKDLLNDESICRIVGSMGELPSLPRVYEELTQALASPDASLAHIARIVERDVAISAKILQLVNSAFFGLAQPITTIRGAVSYLGINMLKNLVLSVEVFRAFKADKKVAGFSLERLQKHAQLTARVASRLPAQKHLADVVMVAALLHDVGKLILAWKLPDRFLQALDRARAEGRPMHAVEKDLSGVTHAEIGAYLLGLWGLPYAIVEAVAHHHAPDRVPHTTFDALAAVYVANLLAHEEELPNPPGLTPWPPPIDTEFVNALGFAESLPQWRATAAEMARASPLGTFDED